MVGELRGRPVGVPLDKIRHLSMMKGRTVVVLNMDGEIGVAGFIRYVCRGPRIDLNGLVSGGVIRRTCSDFEEVLVCHSSYK